MINRKIIISLILVTAAFRISDSTHAMLFKDTETSTGNSFGASTFDLQFGYPEDNQELRIGAALLQESTKEDEKDYFFDGKYSEEITINNAGSMELEYFQEFKLVSGEGVCQYYDIKVYDADENELYNGSLPEFSILDLQNLSPEQSATYNYELEMDNDLPDSLAGQQCVFSIVFKATQVGFDFEQAYYDTEEYNFVLDTYESGEEKDVIINEIMWGGSTESEEDEWIELYNNEDEPVDISGWRIENAGDDEALVIENGIIEPNSYFLISNFETDHENSAINDEIEADYVSEDIDLDNSGEQLKLVDWYGNTIDETPDTEDWADGIFIDEDKDEDIQKLVRSMERNDEPEDGTSEDHWHTCTDEECNDTDYWDEEGNNYGTPKAENHSEGDLSDEEKEDLEKEQEIASEQLEELEIQALQAPIVPETIPQEEDVEEIPEFITKKEEKSEDDLEIEDVDLDSDNPMDTNNQETELQIEEEIVPADSLIQLDIQEAL